MGTRGPKPDPDQAAKGYPGKRKAKADKARIEAETIAWLLKPRPEGSADLPPALQDELYAPAALIWRQLAPELRRTHRLPAESEHLLVMACIYAQEWYAATHDLHANGFAQNVKTVAGGMMERRRPKNFDRQQAYSNLVELSAKFGLTPVDMYNLFRGQANAAMSNPGLFGDDRQPANPSPSSASAPAATEGEGPADPSNPPASRVGGLSSHRGTPPTKPN